MEEIATMTMRARGEEAIATAVVCRHASDREKEYL